MKFLKIPLSSKSQYFNTPPNRDEVKEFEFLNQLGVLHVWNK